MTFTRQRPYIFIISISNFISCTSVYSQGLVRKIAYVVDRIRLILVIWDGAKRFS